MNTFFLLLMRWTLHSPWFASLGDWAAGLNIVLWRGKNAWEKRPDSGFFYCPRCRSRRPYLRQKAAGFAFAGEGPAAAHTWVECLNCRQSFDPDLLEYDHVLEEVRQSGVDLAIKNSQTMLRLRQAMLLVAQADHLLGAAEIKCVQDVVEELAGWRPSAEDLQREAVQLAREGASFASVLDRDLQWRQDGIGRVFYQSLARVASAAGPWGPQQEVLMRQVGARLDVSAEQCAAWNAQAARLAARTRGPGAGDK